MYFSFVLFIECPKKKNNVTISMISHMRCRHFLQKNKVYDSKLIHTSHVKISPLKKYKQKNDGMCDTDQLFTINKWLTRTWPAVILRKSYGAPPLAGILICHRSRGWPMWPSDWWTCLSSRSVISLWLPQAVSHLQKKMWTMLHHAAWSTFFWKWETHQERI